MRQTSFQAFLFAAILLLFNWPILSIVPIENQIGQFVYIFTTWGIIIILLFCSTKASEEDHEDNNSP